MKINVIAGRADEPQVGSTTGHHTPRVFDSDSVPADRGLVASLNSATLGMDLAAPPVVAPTPVAPVSVGAAGQQPWPLVNYGPGSTSSAEITQLVGTVNKGGKAIGGIIAIIVLASVVVPIAGAIRPVIVTPISARIMKSYSNITRSP